MTSPLSSRNAVLIWIALMLPLAVAHVWLSRIPPRVSWAIPTGVAPIYTGFEWLRFHPAHAPKSPGERTMVVLGSSNIAGWGEDYRWGTRRKLDPFARHSFPAYLQRSFERDGVPLRVVNLAVNGGKLRSQVFLHLDALREKPDYIVLALSSWSFIRDGDFRDPLPLLQMNRALEELLANTDYPSKQKTESEFLAYLQTQPRPRVKVTRELSACDQVTAWCAARLRGAYDGIGVPDSVAAPTPDVVVDSVRRQEEEKRAHWNDDDLKPGVIFEEMVALFPKALPILRESAARQGTKLIVLAPPSSERWEDWFNGERMREAMLAGIRVVDLRSVPVRAEQETYDGHHYTREGNRKLAEEFAGELRRGGDVK